MEEGIKITSDNEIKDETSLIDKLILLQAELYDLIVDAWLERQIAKLKKLGALELKDGTVLTKKEFLEFNQMLAVEMSHRRTKYLEGSLASEILRIDNEVMTLLRTGGLIDKVGDHKYAFLHDSLCDHFCAKKILHGIVARCSFELGYPLNEKLIVDQAKLVNSLADKVKNDSGLEKLLFELLETSKSEPIVAIGAANAITLLHRAGIKLSGLSLSRVRIQGADLTGALLDDVDFTEADLRHVKFVEASLSRVNFTSACMDGVEFGEQSDVENQAKCDQTIITFATGLSTQNRRFLEHHSSIGQVSQQSSKKIIFVRDQMETVTESCVTSFGYIIRA